MYVQLERRVNCGKLWCSIMFSCGSEPLTDTRHPFPAECFHHHHNYQQPPQQEDLYSTHLLPPPPPPPPPPAMLHYASSTDNTPHLPPPPPPPSGLPHSSMVGYCQQQQQQPGGYDFAYCETQWTAFYDGGQHCSQYEAYCVREAYHFSSSTTTIQVE